MSEKKLNFFLDTPLGDDVLIVESFSGTEEVSKIYNYVVEAKSDKTSLIFDAMVGKPVSLMLTLADNKKRFISGHVMKFIQYSRLDDLNHYHIEIVPWLWFLQKRSDCRIFQGKSALDIIKEVFDNAGFSGKYETKTIATYRKREYCVQYRETDFNFVSRLMEEEGIFYYFTHTQDSHVLVLGDSPSAHQPLQPSGDVIYYRSSEQEVRRPVVMDFIAEHSVKSTKVSLRDFDFTKPSTDLMVVQNSNDEYELYNYPGNYTERSDGEHYAKVQLEREQSFVKTFCGNATERRFTTGSTFRLIEHPREEYNASYLLTSVSHTGSQNAEEPTYSCSFECIPSDVPFRPESDAKKPELSGCQTAVVVGPSGEEIWLDKYGRVKVQFHWDRLGKKDENSSCWIRVARSWAGKNWGFMFHPRIGQEVIVQFIEGDIDRPIITGSVYNEELMPPYQLPANSTQSTIKSRSSKDGTPENFNEIRFQDKKGEEHFLIHAEKDHMVEVENDETHSVGHDETESIGNNRTVTVQNDDTLTVHNNETITIDGNRTENVKKDESVTITGNRNLTVEKNSTIDITKNETKTIGENQDVSVNKNMTLKVSENRETDIGKKEILNIGKEWIVDAGDKIVIQCGQASITLKKDGTVEISGKNIKTTGSGKIDISAAMDVKVHGSKVALN